MRFEWGPRNIAHIGRHGMTPAQVEAIFAAPDFAVDYRGTGRWYGSGTIGEIRYRVAFVSTAHPEPTVYVVTAYRAERGHRRKP